MDVPHPVNSAASPLFAIAPKEGCKKNISTFPNNANNLHSISKELVGPSTSCPMTCHGSANDDLRAICRCHDENECEWVPKTSCNELAPECDDPSTIDFGAGLSVFCSEEVRRKMLSRPKRSSMACQVTCADDGIFSGKPPKQRLFRQSTAVF